MEFFRGDTYNFKFQRMSKGQTITELPNNIYFTVKDGYYTDNVIFQKKLNDGITKDDEDWYHVMISPSDTNGLEYKDYNYDLEVITDTYTKTINSGVLRFKKETTFPENEV